MKTPEGLKDIGAERALLGTIISKGKDAFIDASDLVSAADFTLPLNRDIYSCVSKMADETECESFDPELIKVKAEASQGTARA